LLEQCWQVPLTHNLQAQVGSCGSLLYLVRELGANFFGLLGLSRHSSDSSLRNSAPRGPPRKPKQSGHALWVGNLPPGTHIADLKEHFSRSATKEIESVFLISKSNCAFVNYKTETACAEAMTRFHDSRFQGVRLVCRLRRGSAATASATLVNPASGAVSADGMKPKAPSTAGPIQQVGEPEQLDEKNTDAETPSAVPKAKEKFFVVKSLTVEDLDLSVRNGIWATQAHNEAALNKAYEVSISIGFIFPEKVAN
jgi:RNA recognition motif-containing protein